VITSRHYQELFDNLPEAVLFCDREGKVLAANRSACELLVVADHDLPWHSILDFLDVAEGFGQELLARWRHGWSGSANMVRGDGSRFRAEVATIANRSGEKEGQLCLLVREVARRESGGRAAGAERPFQPSGYPGQAAAEAGSPVDSSETLRSIVQLSVQNFATFSMVYLALEAGGMEVGALAHADPRLRPLLERLRALHLSLTEESVLARTLSSGKSYLFAGADPGIDQVFGPEGEQRRLLTELEPTSAIAVPLRARGESIGSMTFFRTEGRYPPFAAKDIGVAQMLAQSAAFAMENARLYAQAREAAHVRDELLAVVAHELRSPLGAISVSTELLLGFDLGREAKSHHLEIIQRASARMSRLIQDLVDSARIESGHLPIERAPNLIGDVAREACELVGALAWTKRIRVELTTNSPIPAVPFDRYRVLQVLSNLLENAVKFTPIGGEIRLHMEWIPAGVLVRISDTGPGIPEHQMPHIFTRFWQGPGKDFGGAGLGLAIVRGIVEAHGGQIWVENGVDGGTSFVFTLPSDPESPLLISYPVA
jgi:signal transduction histidine kinase